MFRFALPALLLCAGRIALGATDRDAILAGVRVVGAPGIPGGVTGTVEGAFPVVAGTAEGIPVAVVAAARWSAGRVVVFGHDGYLAGEHLAAGDTTRLMTNAIRWVGGGRKAPRVGVLAPESFAVALAEAGLSVTRLGDTAADGGLAELDVICLDPARLSPAGEAAVAAFTRSGGGLVAANTGWGWLQLNPGRSLVADHPGNRLLAGCGLAWTDAMVDRTTPDGFMAGGKAVLPPNAPEAMELLSRGGPAAVTAAWTLLAAARCATVPGSPFATRLAQWRSANPSPPPPSATAPVSMTADPKRWLAFALPAAEGAGAPPDTLESGPGANEFPGAVAPTVPRVRRTVVIDLGRPGWQGTGLYAPPGARLTVRVPAGAEHLGLRIRIGCHSDELWHLTEWMRAPDVSREFAVTGVKSIVGNAWGGPVYVVVPDAFARGRAPVTISGGIEMPRFVKGVTRVVDWNGRLRTLAAPWAELESDRVVLTLPASVAAGVRDPVRILAFWDKILAAQAELAGAKPHPRRKERIIADVQISAGYMHSGYPIMVHLDAAEVMVDPHRLATDRRGGPGWGFFHELGHNLQQDDWTFDGTREVTCNLFALYAFDRVCGIPPRETRDELTPDRRLAGATRDRWLADPFVALQPYVILQEEFGWEFYRKVFAAYRAMPEAARPTTDADRISRWILETSKAAGRDLSGFWERWGLPVSAAKGAATPAR